MTAQASRRGRYSTSGRPFGALHTQGTPLQCLDFCSGSFQGWMGTVVLGQPQAELATQRIRAFWSAERPVMSLSACAHPC